MTATQNPELVRRLDRLTSPRSVAVIGASPRRGHFANQPLVNLRRYGFTGEIYPVNPTHRTVEDLKCYPTVADLPDIPDLAIIAVRPALAVETAGLCAGLGVGAAVVVGSGFAEADDDTGRGLQNALRELRLQTGLRICGPNTLGIANFNDRVVGFASGNLPPAPMGGSLAVVSQSGGCSFTLANRAWATGVGVGHIAVLGNEVDVTIPDMLVHYLERDDVSAVICYLEAIRDPDGLRRAAWIADHLGKSLFVLKSGISARGRSAAAAHTGALATSDAVLSGALRQWGIGRATTFDGLVAAGALAARFGRPGGNRLGVYAQGGGLAVMTSDICERVGVELAAIAPDTVSSIKALLPDTTPANPLDSGGQFLGTGPEPLTEALTAFASDAAVDAVAYCMMPITGHRAEVYSAGLIAAAQRSLKPGVVLQYTAGTLTERAEQSCRAGGLLVFDRPEGAFEGLRLWLETSRTSAKRASLRQSASSASGNARSLISRWREEGITVVGQHRAAELLALYGISQSPTELAITAVEAVNIAGRMAGPVVLKIESAQLPHRSDVGGVALGVPVAEVGETFERLLDAARAAEPEALIDGVTVSPMADAGTEMIVGAHVDPVFGPTVLVGMGGVWAELFNDSTVRLAPVSADVADDMVKSLRGVAVLQGARGAASVDLAALGDLVIRLSEMVTDLADVVDSVDLNPVRCYRHGVIALDALMTFQAKDECG